MIVNSAAIDSCARDKTEAVGERLSNAYQWWNFLPTSNSNL